MFDTLPIPTLEGQPISFTTHALPPALVQLGQTMADMDFFTASDLRTGAAGPRRMIEKAWQRWWDDAGGYRNPVSLKFKIAYRVAKPLDDSHAWLIVAPGRLTRWYTADADTIANHSSELAEHALATLYAGLDAICYALKAPDFLTLAKAYWWAGEDSEKPLLARAKAAKAQLDKLPKGALSQVFAREELDPAVRGVLRGGFIMPTRRRFDHRYPLLHQAPRRHPEALKNAPPMFGKLACAIRNVESSLRSPNLLRRNAAELTGTPHCGHFSIIVRARYGDYMTRLLDDHFGAMKMAREASFNFHSAWPLGTPAQIMRAKNGLSPTIRLANALSVLLSHIGHSASNMRGF